MDSSVLTPLRLISRQMPLACEVVGKKNFFQASAVKADSAALAPSPETSKSLSNNRLS